MQHPQTTTDAQGRYVFAAQQPGAYGLSVSARFTTPAELPCGGMRVTDDGWFFILGTQKDGGHMLIGVLGEDNDIHLTAGMVARKDIDLDCDR